MYNFNSRLYFRLTFIARTVRISDIRIIYHLFQGSSPVQQTLRWPETVLVSRTTSGLHVLPQSQSKHSTMATFDVENATDFRFNSNLAPNALSDLAFYLPCFHFFFFFRMNVCVNWCLRLCSEIMNLMISWCFSPSLYRFTILPWGIPVQGIDRVNEQTKRAGCQANDRRIIRNWETEETDAVKLDKMETKWRHDCFL